MWLQFKKKSFCAVRKRTRERLPVWPRQILARNCILALNKLVSRLTNVIVLRFAGICCNFHL